MNNENYPFGYDFINANTSLVMPSTIHASQTGVANFFKKYFLQRAISVYKWNIPEHWNFNYFIYTLYCWGFISVLNTDRFGVIPQQCGLQGYNVMYNPTKAVISNPLLIGQKILTIGKQCEIIKMQQDYTSILDIVSYYATLAALATETITVNLLNSRLSYLFAAENKQIAESFKKLMDKVLSGEPCAVGDRWMLHDDGTPAIFLLQQNVGQNYIADRVMVDLKKIVNDFDSFIGIPNSNTEKKERMIVDEVASNDVETKSLASLWLEEMQDGCRRAENMFGITLSVDWRFKNEGGSNNGVAYDSFRDGNV